MSSESFTIAWPDLRQRVLELVESGQNAAVETLLVEHPGLRAHEQLLIDCIYAEFCFREERSRSPQPNEYLIRFPEYVEQLRSLFEVHQALDSQSLIGNPASPQEQPAEKDQTLDSNRIGESQAQAPSRRIGPYKLLQLIGEGGMGAVYMADQLEPVKRRVALKLIKSGMGSKLVIARFEAERQALAMMDHQNIAKVLDAGISKDGTPYFAMELVQGMPITKYCDREKLSIPDRMKLFVQVCRALQHAHQKGVIHRDIKPSNVLVTQRDGVPVAKVIDFGLAKALQSENRLTDKTLFTEIGQVCGTLEYMSPEQAEMNELGLDTRTDVYSLGVLLYELLTGSTPLGHDRVIRAAVHRVLELIITEEATRPSRRLSESGEAITGISAQRRIEPSHLSGILKRELDWIALKALEKDRNRRYDGAGSLADDVQNYLNGNVVTARPPSHSYRLRKAIRKHRTAFVSGTLFVLLLIGGLIGTGSMWLRARTAEFMARGEAEKAKIAESTAKDEAKKAHEAEAKARIAETDAVTQRDYAQTAKTQAERNLVASRNAVDQFFTAVSENQLLNSLGMQKLRHELLNHARDYYVQFLVDNADNPSLRVEVAAAHFRVAQAAIEGDGDTTAIAIESVRKGLDILEELIRETPGKLDLGSLTQGVYKGRLRFAAGSESEGKRLSRVEALIPLVVASKIIALWTKLIKLNPDSSGMKNDLAGLYNIQGILQDSAGLQPLAEVSFNQSIKRWTDLLQDDQTNANYKSDLAMAYSNLAQIYLERSKAPAESAASKLLETAIQLQLKAVKLQREIVARDPELSFFAMDLAGTCRMIGRLYAQQGDRNEAVKYYREANKHLQNCLGTFQPIREQQAEIARLLDRVESGMDSLPDKTETK